MKNKIYLFVPINIGRNLESLLKRKAPDIDFISPSSPSEELKYFKEIFTNPQQKELPELIVTLQPETLKYFENEEVSQHYTPINEQFAPLRQDLYKKQFFSTQTLVKPLLYVPLIMLINKEMKNPPKTWLELLEKEFYGRVIAPNLHTPVSMAFNFFMQEMAGDRPTHDFFKQMTYSGLPFDVITGVNKGYYDIGVLPLPFARYNMGQNIERVVPQEGAMVLPQMMFLKKDACEQTLEIANELFGKNIQRFFSQLGALIPVIEEIPLPTELKETMNFYWKNWDWYHQLAINYKLPKANA